MSDLLEAARSERDRRAEVYPRQIAEGGDALALSLDFHCWCAIAEWLETDRFASFEVARPGGGEPVLVRWPELEAAAKKALDARAAKIGALEGAANADPGTLGALRQRRSCLFTIHRKVGAMRERIDAINAEFRARREKLNEQPREGIAA